MSRIKQIGKLLNQDSTPEKFAELLIELLMIQNDNEICESDDDQIANILNRLHKKCPTQLGYWIDKNDQRKLPNGSTLAEESRTLLLMNL